MNLEEVRSHIGDFEIIRPIGSGGMAQLYLCNRRVGRGMPQQFVVKVPHLRFLSDQSFVEMFLDEARLVVNLRHPNLVRVEEVDAINGIPYIVMEHVWGPDLRTLCERARANGSLKLPYVARILADACRGLHHAHNAVDGSGRPLRVVHRDVSPQNIMVSAIDGTTKVIDFGIAKAAHHANNTEVGVLKGKLMFMAPEQLKGASLDHRADQFGLGVTAYIMSTGQMPFDGSDQVATWRQRMAGVMRSPSDVSPGFPYDFEWIILTAMEHDPAERFVSCEHLAVALEGYAKNNGAPTSADIADWTASLASDGDTMWAKPSNPKMQSAGSESKTLGRLMSSPQLLHSRGGGLYTTAGGGSTTPDSMSQRTSSFSSTGARRGSVPPPALAAVSPRMAAGQPAPEKSPRRRAVPPWAWVVGVLAAVVGTGFVLVVGFEFLYAGPQAPIGARSGEVTADEAGGGEVAPPAVDEVRSLISEGQDLQQRGDLDTARLVLLRALEAAGGSVVAGEVLGHIGEVDRRLVTRGVSEAIDAGDLVDARVALDAALLNTPDDPELTELQQRLSGLEAGSGLSDAPAVAAAPRSRATTSRARSSRPASRLAPEPPADGPPSAPPPTAHAPPAAVPQVVAPAPAPAAAPAPAPAPVAVSAPPGTDVADPAPAVDVAPAPAAAPSVALLSSQSEQVAAARDALPASVVVRDTAELRTQCRQLEVKLTEAGLDSDVVTGVSAALENTLIPAIESDRTVEIYPRAMFQLILTEAQKGASKREVGTTLRKAHTRGELGSRR